MESEKYNMVLEEVYGLMRGEALETALAESKPAVRVDAVQDILREALRASSISMFNGKPYFFGGRIYEELKWILFENLIHDLLKKIHLPHGDYSRLEGIIRVCKRIIYTKVLNPDNSVVVFKNCVFDVKNRTMHDFGPEWVQITSVPYNYDPKERVMGWQLFLDQVLPNREMQMVLQEFLGSIFIDRRTAKLKTMLILKGPGSNGKSVVFETVMGVLGRENVKNYGLGQLIGGSERFHNLVQVNGKRLNYCSEIQALEIGKDSDTLKALISGEPIEARTLYQEGFTVYNLPLLMANANIMPYLRDWSHGMRRRFCIIPFDQVVPAHRQNKGLAKELEQEYPAIFNWMLQGRDRFIRNGHKLTFCKELETVLDEYQSESSSVMRFMFSKEYRSEMSDVTDAEPKWEKSTALYSQYRKWCDENAVSPHENVTRFGRILSEAGFKKRRTAEGQLYAVFGRRAIAQMVQHRKVKYEKPVDYTPEYHRGILCARSYAGLAHVTGAPEHMLRKLVREGLLPQTSYHSVGSTKYFHLEEVEAYLYKTKILTRKTIAKLRKYGKSTSCD